MKILGLLLALVISTTSFAEVKRDGTILESYCSKEATSKDQGLLQSFCFATIVGEEGEYVVFTYASMFAQIVGQIVSRRLVPVAVNSSETKEELTISFPGHHQKIKVFVTKDQVDPVFAIVRGETPFGNEFTAWNFELVFHTEAFAQ